MCFGSKDQIKPPAETQMFRVALTYTATYVPLDGINSPRREKELTSGTHALVHHVVAESKDAAEARLVTWMKAEIFGGRWRVTDKWAHQREVILVCDVKMQWTHHYGPVLS